MKIFAWTLYFINVIVCNLWLWEYSLSATSLNWATLVLDSCLTQVGFLVSLLILLLANTWLQSLSPSKITKCKSRMSLWAATITKTTWCKTKLKPHTAFTSHRISFTWILCVTMWIRAPKTLLLRTKGFLFELSCLEFVLFSVASNVS